MEDLLGQLKGAAGSEHLILARTDSPLLAANKVWQERTASRWASRRQVAPSKHWPLGGAHCPLSVGRIYFRPKQRTSGTPSRNDRLVCGGLLR